MKKRIASICLIIVLMVTNIGFTPSADEWITVPVSSLLGASDTVATPSMATDSEATPSTATKSEANKKVLVSVDPEEDEIPEYYVRISSSGNKFWKFDDRYGGKNYRTFGYIQGEVEFSEWYETDETGRVVDEPINLDEEFYDLAPYIYQGATPAKSDWSSLSWRLFGSSDGITRYSKIETRGFNNWDASSYVIWKLEGDEVTLADQGYYFFGIIVNIEGSGTSGNWYDAEKSGSILGKVTAISFMAVSAGVESVKSYEVKFVDWDGTPIGDAQYVLEGQSAEEPENPKRYGYTFSKWSSNSYKNVTANMTIKAVYTENKQITVNFRDAQEGGVTNRIENILYTQTVYEGESITVPDLDLDKIQYVEGYTPTGAWTWKSTYFNGNFESMYLNPKVTTDEILEVWPELIRNTYTIYLHNEQTDQIEEIPTQAGSTLSISVSKYFARDGYRGYARLDESGTSLPNTMPDHDLHLYVYWIPQQYTVQYISNLTGVSSPSNNYCNYGSVVNVTKKVSKTGYVFLGWFLSKNADSTDEFKTGYIMPSHNLTVYGHWALATNKVTFKDSDGTEIGSTQNVKYGETAVAPDDPTSPEAGRVFRGWFTEKTGGRRIVVDETPITKETILYAQYGEEIPVYTVMFESSDGIVISTQHIDAGGAATAPTAIPEKEGCTFVGWDKDYTNIQKDTVIISQYSKNTYQLIFASNGGDTGYVGVKQTQIYNVEYGANIDQLLKDTAALANRENYNFAGWYDARSGGNKYSYTAGNTMPAGNLTVYGQWTQHHVNVTYINHDGSLIEVQTIPIGGESVAPEAQIREGYTFLAWKYDISQLTVAANFKNIKRDFEFTAHYTTNKYNLYLNGNGAKSRSSGEETITAASIYYGNTFLASEESAKKFINEGYTFLGWYTLPIGGEKYRSAGNYMPDHDVTLYAHWSRTHSVVTYVDWDGTVLDTQEVWSGEETTPPTPTRSGYTFIGWDMEPTEIKDNVTFTAQYVKGMNLIFKGNGGTIESEAYKAYAISSGDSFDSQLAECESNVSRKYYVFDGWYTDPLEGIEYTDSGNVMADDPIIIYAHWTRASSSVVFEDWQDKILSTQDIPLGGDAIPPEVPNRTGYTFTGWDKEYTNIQDHVVIKAQYDTASYTLTIDGNGGTMEGNDKLTYSVKYETDIREIFTEAINKLTWLNHTLRGLYTAAKEGTKYSLTDEIEMPGSNKMVYAQWSRDTNLVTYKDWNGTTIKTQNVPIGGSATPPGNPVRSGYQFTGWDKESINIQEDTVITAQYIIGSYRLTLNGNGGTVGENQAKTQEFVYGESIDQFLVAGRDSASRANYIFEGWFIKAVDGSQFLYDGCTMPGEDTTLYAHWTRSNNEVIYKDWNGTFLDTQDVAIGGNATPPADPERTGYTFTGWDKESTNIQADTVITAQYSKNSYQLTLDGNGGTIGGDQTETETVLYGTSIDQILTNGRDSANRTYYSFEGWYTDPVGGEKYSYSGNTMPATSVIVYAHWVEKIFNTCLVTYQDWDGTILKTQEVINGGDATPPKNPVRDGYTFTSWDTESTNIQADTIITALYSKNIYSLTLDGNGGTINGNTVMTKIVKYGDSFDQILIDGRDSVSRSDYTFIGWYTGPVGGEKYSYSGNIMPASNIIIYAHWLMNTITTIVDSDDETKEVVTPVTSLVTAPVVKEVPDSGGTFTVNPENPYDVTYTKDDGSLASDEWVGDGTDWYHINENSKIDYSWYLEDKENWYKLNNEPGEKFGAAIKGWFYEPMDDKKYYFDPGTTSMLTGWQELDGNWYYFTTRNEGQTYFGSNGQGWVYDPEKPGKPYGSMYRNEHTLDGHFVDENGALV